MKTISHTLAILGLILVYGLAHAQSEPVLYAWGVGSLSCGDWIEDTKRPAPRAQYTDWVLGFVTSYNYYNMKRQVNPPDRPSVSAWIDKYCRDNPLHRVFMAAAALLEELGGPKAQHQWKR